MKARGTVMRPANINWMIMFILLVSTGLFYSCAATMHTGQKTIETVEVIADAKEEIGEETKRLRGRKIIQGKNEGCSDVHVRSTDGTIYGTIPAKSGAVIKVPIGMFPDTNDEFTLQANHVDPTPPDCDDRGVDFEDFDKDTDTEDWRFRLR